MFGKHGESDDGVLHDLNEAQRAAVEHEGGPLLIVAGAGSGKTLTLAHRVAHLIHRGVPPQRILLLTFSRRASAEMLSRAALLVPDGGAGRVWGGTFHAIANRLLRLHGAPIGVRPDFTVLDQADGADLMDLIRGDLGLSATDRRFPRKDTLASIYSRVVNAGIRLEEVVQRSFPWCTDSVAGMRTVFRRYGERKVAANALDFDDLLVWWRALATDPLTGPRVAERFDHVLVDEYQDTNALQADVLRAMWAHCPNLTVVGDDAQAIYSFRAATVRNILDFPVVFPGTVVVTLERNYRSTPPILQVANAVAEGAPERHHKTLRPARAGARRAVLVTCPDEPRQSEEVCRQVLAHLEKGTLLRRQAVLFRTAHHSDHLEVELARRNIPFVKYGGLRFLEAAHVKDVMAVLRVLDNPLDEVSWFRVLQLLDGVGPAGARRVIRDLGVHEGPGEDGAGPLRRLLEEAPSVPASAGADLERLRTALSACEGTALPPAAQVEGIRVFLEPVIHRRYSSPAARLRDLDQLEQMASRSPTRARFVTDLTLDPPASTGDLAGPPLLDEDYLVLSTVHSAKGGEWDVVHVIHAADGMIPSDMATGHPEEIEEERRLFYVALTRARDALYVYFPLRYYRRPKGSDDIHSYSQLTRFLPPSVRTLFEERGIDVDLEETNDEVMAARGGRAAAEVNAYLDGLWS